MLVLIDDFLFLLCGVTYADKTDTHACTEDAIKKVLDMAGPSTMTQILSKFLSFVYFLFRNDLKIERAWRKRTA